MCAIRPHVSPSPVWQHSGMQVVALVNDTVGTMMACGYDDPKCEIGLIVGEEHLFIQEVPCLLSAPLPYVAWPRASARTAMGVTPARGLQGQGPMPVTWRR